ncbi:MAG: glycogen/starch/alpha-glucan phosphorylase [SAR324 cluster bacterium]|jgi:starch phosphorylase|nr:glycogen/starch/alpha-glucan phosphorylase [SAR324 cluster bacterium]MEE1575933.1 glycogen/starch/alpha-glucan phosphorylase [Deltaproteobacteria bacterium]MDP6331213.1 glycogen/starch/alpha-glucan phosphorylase [SAR324 cluster bacterium]MDP6462631.1 glycogen/starch/alpha-glucan phosphorylase [SAR324 cluster bacterium]MDP7139808.1 glycogen/starch/alpha-glucan phosphorylase [SAR324 cluster bacterium]|tara:strand:- start:29 stop:2536 length:2508 start_codon:yes stop_codon:yes gene_type:complete
MPQNRPEMEKIWDLIADYRRLDSEGLIHSMAHHLEFSQCKNRYTVEDFDVYRSLTVSLRDRLVEFWNDTQQTYHLNPTRQVYYLSLEYLVGRSLRNNLINLGIYEECREALRLIGYDLDEIEEMEVDAGLGNGGLGRLASCFLDSMATLQIPAHAYGIRYEFGIFQQMIERGEQKETPDNWLSQGYPWEIPRWDVLYPVQFYGYVQSRKDDEGREWRQWVGGESVQAMAYDVPVSGYQNQTVNNLRLWSAKASKVFDFQIFNRGDYMQAVEEKQRSETISKVLYPNDQGFSGKELRLKQQYFFVSASLQDIIRRFKAHHSDFSRFHEWVAIQLNDTHPSIAIPELMRLLIDEEGLEWLEAWEVVIQVFSYTNHTVLPEALERWSSSMLGHLLPRHLEIIYEINRRFIEQVRISHPGDENLAKRVSLVEDGPDQQIRMPYLSIIGSHAVNGVAALHTKLLKTTVFEDFFKLFPERFLNKTNGITPRLWLLQANPELAELITSRIGHGWGKNLEELRSLEQHLDNDGFQAQWREVKQLKKNQLLGWLEKKNGYFLNPSSFFDVQIKRIHEYKRQLLNLLHTVYLYRGLREDTNLKPEPRTVILAGKAAPGYFAAKLIIKLTHDIADVINNDPLTSERLQLVFIENYGVTVAEKLIPATDLSQHISTAGTEASGTGNMKFSLNGALILGTLDGANIEIREEVGEENLFAFGLDSDSVGKLRSEGYRPSDYLECNRELEEVLEMIESGHFNPGRPELYSELCRDLREHDHFMLLADFDSYLRAQHTVVEARKDQKSWTRKSIMNTAGSGKFSSDRTILEYAQEIWKVEPVPTELHGHKI